MPCFISININQSINLFHLIQTSYEPVPKHGSRFARPGLQHGFTACRGLRPLDPLCRPCRASKLEYNQNIGPPVHTNLVPHSCANISCANKSHAKICILCPKSCAHISHIHISQANIHILCQHLPCQHILSQHIPCQCNLS